MSEKIENLNTSDYLLDFNTSSAIDRIELKFLVFYILIFWFAGILTIVALMGILDIVPVFVFLIFLPIMLIALYYTFFFGCLLFTKLFLIIINLIYKPKQGVFLAEKDNKDYEFWRLRVQLKKLGVWLLNNCPLPYCDTWAFRWFGVKMDFSSHLHEAWVDMEFIKFGRKVTVGQGAVVMTSMIVGKYLIINECIFDDYTVIGGVSTIAPGTIIGKDTVIGAFSSTNYKQILEEGWIYFGIPAIKLKPNKYAEERKDLIVKRDVDKQISYETKADVILDEDTQNLIKNKKEDI